jgi:hypothetical protein
LRYTRPMTPIAQIAQNPAGNEPALPDRWAAEVEPLALPARKPRPGWKSTSTPACNLPPACSLSPTPPAGPRPVTTVDGRRGHCAPASRLTTTTMPGSAPSNWSTPRPPGRLALHAGQKPGRDARDQRIRPAPRQPVSGQPVLRSTDDICPKCKAPLPPGEDECPICNREATEAPSTWTLFRLWRFARPYRWQLLSGFLLTLAATAAHAGAALPDHAADGQCADPVPERQADRLAAGHHVPRRPARRRPARLGARLDPHLHPGADVRTHRPRPAHHHLRTPARPVAGIFRRQADRRPDGTHRQRDRPHQCLPLTRPAQLRDRRADDRHDRGHPVLDQPVAGAGHLAAVADHRLDDPLCPRKAAHRFRERSTASGPK